MKSDEKYVYTTYKTDIETGETEIADGLYLTKDQLDARENYKKNVFYSDFVWILFNYGETLFPDLSEANLSRLIYASTFCDYNGILPNKKALKSEMGMSDQLWSKFYTSMVEQNIFIESDKNIRLNTKFIAKGSIKRDQPKMRLFCEFVREIYKSCDGSKAYRQLSYLFRLIPFINRKTNAACSNPEEQDINKIRYLTFGEFCDAIGYDKKNARRLIKDLLSIKYNGQQLIGFFVTDLNMNKWKIIVNPKIYYAGEYGRQLQEQMTLFSDGNISNRLLPEDI